MRKRRRTHARPARGGKKISPLRRLLIGGALLVFLVGAVIAFRNSKRVSAVDMPFTFTVAGDWGFGTNAQNNLAQIPGTGAAFTLAVGDLSYSSSTSAKKEPEWCAMVKAKTGDTYPFQLVTGNHENVLSLGTLIENYVACLPDRMNSVISPYGVYGREYYFDYHGVRFLMLSPDMLDMSGDPYSYDVESNRYFWVRDRVREAKLANMWVVVGMHKVCITVGKYKCETQNLMDMLIDEKADLVFTGHEHNYQRSKQLTCIVPNYYKSSCTQAFDTRGGTYIQGEGTTIVTVGTGGVSLYDVNTSDSEAPYFAAYSGKNINPSYGQVKVSVTQTGMSLDFAGIGSGTFTDHFDITAAPLPPAVPTTTITASLLADATIQQSYPTTNYGTATTIGTDASPVKDFLIKFDVSGLSGRPVLKAKLRLYSVDSSALSGDVYRTSDTSWIESGTGGVTWNTAPAAGALVGSLAETAQNRWYEIDVTEVAQSEGVVGFRIKSTSTDGAAFTSLQGGTAIPKLLISVADGLVPTPTPTPVVTPTSTATPTSTPSATPTSTPLPSSTPAPSGTQSELTFPVSEDSFIAKGSPTTNYGSYTVLQNDVSPVRDILLKFAVAGVAGRTVSAATIRVYNKDGSPAGGEVYTAVNNDWTEMAVNWNNAPALGTFIRSIGPVTGTSTTPVLYAIDVTGFVTGDGTYSFRIPSLSADSADYVSKQGSSTRIPTLVLTVQ